MSQLEESRTTETNLRREVSRKTNQITALQQQLEESRDHLQHSLSKLESLSQQFENTIDQQATITVNFIWWLISVASPQIQPSVIPSLRECALRFRNPRVHLALYGPCKTSNPISVRKCDKFPVVGWFAHSSPPIKESTVTSETGKEIRKVK